MRIESGRTRSLRIPLAVSAVLLGLGLAEPPPGRLRTVHQELRSLERNRADREAGAGGYYEDLISGGTRADGSRSPIALRLLGKPTDILTFHDMKATHYIDGDFLQFVLRPNIQCPAFDHVFTTNSLGLRDREGYSVAKPEGVFRIALLGSSMDMGWGVATGETYENLLENWLNHYAAKQGLERRFEVLNFAMAAYGPAQRLESYRRKATHFEPDLVLYSATMLDPRLSQIHLCELFEQGGDPTYEFMHQVITEIGLETSELRRTPDGILRARAVIKARLKPWLWSISDGALGELAALCRSQGRALACLIIPRVGLGDAPDERAAAVARHKAIASQHAIPVIDLSATFDNEDPADLEIAPWDDHPNTLGHRLLFVGLAEAIVADKELSRLIFGP
ncbi:hypothetical protein BH23PLA1_BH23PLA1_16850 [soil metagenome]